MGSEVNGENGVGCGRVGSRKEGNLSLFSLQSRPVSPVLLSHHFSFTSLSLVPSLLFHFSRRSPLTSAPQGPAFGRVRGYDGRDEVGTGGYEGWNRVP